MKLGLVYSVLALGLCVVACSAPTGGTGDSGSRVDAAREDGAIEIDAATDDASGSDASAPDAAILVDAAPRPDAGMCADLPADPTRPVAIQCSPCRPAGPGGGVGGECVTDADCTAGVNGRCTFGRIGPFCDYDLCFADGDCATNEVCLCDGSRSGTGGGNVCIPAECHVDADCEDGFACSPTLGSCGHYTNFVAYRCHRATDACTTDADCAGGTFPGYCAFDEAAGHWLCSSAECAG
jgi:hypothetical protein